MHHRPLIAACTIGPRLQHVPSPTIAALTMTPRQQHVPAAHDSSMYHRPTIAACTGDPRGQHVLAWASADSFQERRMAKPPTPKKVDHFSARPRKFDHFSVRRRRKRKMLRFLRRFRLNLSVIMRAPKARANISGYFVGEQQMTSFFQIPGGGQVPLPPAGAHVYRRPMMTAFRSGPRQQHVLAAHDDSMYKRSTMTACTSRRDDSMYWRSTMTACTSCPR